MMQNILFRRFNVLNTLCKNNAYNANLEIIEYNRATNEGNKYRTINRIGIYLADSRFLINLYPFCIVATDILNDNISQRNIDFGL